MMIETRQSTPRSWLRLPRRTARLKLTGLYGGLFLLSGAALVAVTYFLFERATRFGTPSLPKVPHAPAIQSLGSALGPAAQSLPTLEFLQQQLTQDQKSLGVSNLPTGSGGAPKLQAAGPFAHIETQLVQDQQKLAKATNHLAQSVHQLAQSGTVQAAQRASDSHQLLVNSGIALAIVSLLAVLAGWLVAGRMLRPIRTITSTARRISSTSLHERLALDGPEDELKELGDTLDGLFARLEAAFDAQRHFVANASHELRTPLTAERTLLQVALDDPDTSVTAWRSTAEEVLASTGEQARLIEALLALASSESGLSGRERVDLAPAVTSCLADLEREIDRHGIHVERAIAPATLDGDLLLVERLAANLLKNAVLHNVPHGSIEVVTGVREGRAFFSVTNSGPVIPAAEVERLFQPFQRLDQGRAHHKDGHGLGLSIVRAIATAHGASITAEPAPDGGVTIEVVFPPPALLRTGDESATDDAVGLAVAST
jgi:signal transduction histidine kinase